MPNKALSPVWRRLAEAEERLSALREAQRVAAKDGKLHLIGSLDAMIEAQERVVAALKAEAGRAEMS